MPVFKNLFSTLAHYPPGYYVVKPHSLPKDLGHNRLIVHKDPQVTGVNRFKYFRRPIIPYIENMGGHVVYAKDKQKTEDANKSKNTNDEANEKNQNDDNRQMFRTIGVQTTYR